MKLRSRSSTLVFILLALVPAILFLTSCSSPETTPQTATSSSSVSKRSGNRADQSAKPSCLNIQDGERHVEFNGQQLVLGEGKRLHKLDLGTQGTCENLEIVKKSRAPSIAIRYVTPANEMKLAIATIKDAKWVLEPVTLARENEMGKKNVASAEWTTDATDHTVLRLTDLRSGEYSVIKP